MANGARDSGSRHARVLARLSHDGTITLAAGAVTDTAGNTTSASFTVTVQPPATTTATTVAPTTTTVTTTTAVAATTTLADGGARTLPATGQTGD